MTTEHTATAVDVGTRTLLEVDDLTLHFRGGADVVKAVDGVSLEVGAGECIGIVGESGSGKSMLARSLVRLLPRVDVVDFSGTVILDGEDLAGLDAQGRRVMRKNLQRVRRNGISMVFQEPLSHLNPTMRIGRQIAEGFPEDVDPRPDDERVADLLAQVELPRNAGIERRYPHELSGGMRQRAMIALALATQPKVLIADEPTTGLDVTVQAQVLNTLSRLHHERGMALILITHDLGIVARMCDRMYVMYAGHVVEHGRTAELFDRPRHPYTKALMDSRPGLELGSGTSGRLEGAVPDLSQLPRGCRFLARCRHAVASCEEPQELRRVGPTADVRCEVLPDLRTSDDGAPALAERSAHEGRTPVGGAGPEVILSANAVHRTFSPRGWVGMRGSAPVRAVRGVSLEARAGRAMAIVGESGCGKSTLARLLLGLQSPTEGTVAYRGADVKRLSGSSWREFRSAVQVVFQDPGASLNPRKTVRRHLAEVLLLHDKATRSTVDEEVTRLLESVGLRPAASFVSRKPSQLSGGQKQRVSIARALAVEPELIIADEALSALDVSVQAQILDLMSALRAERNIGFVLITHDLTVVEEFADDVAVMYLGEVVEQGPKDDVLRDPRHPYTAALLAGRLIADPQHVGDGSRTTTLGGEVPSATSVHAGCALHSRCPVAMDACREDGAPVELRWIDDAARDELAHRSSCLRSDGLPALLA